MQHRLALFQEQPFAHFLTLNLDRDLLINVSLALVVREELGRRKRGALYGALSSQADGGYGKLES